MVPEIEYRRLWKQFYKTIAIEGRNNPRCRRTLMPQRYWGQMTEFDQSDDHAKSNEPVQWRVAETVAEIVPTSIGSLDPTFQYPTRKWDYTYQVLKI